MTVLVASLPAGSQPRSIALDYDRARATMVDGQVRPNKVTDPRIIGAMRLLPREAFVPEALRPLAYLDANLPFGRGRVMLEPMVTARLLQVARPRGGERALVVAGGTGYLSAILARCGVSVSLLDDDPTLLAIARVACAGEVPAIRIFEGDLRAGLPGGAPFDLVVVEGAVAAIPPALASQLAPEGRIVAILTAPDGMSRAVIAERTAAGLGAQPRFDCATPMLPGLLAPPAFRF